MVAVVLAAVTLMADQVVSLYFVYFVTHQSHSCSVGSIIIPKNVARY